MYLFFVVVVRVLSIFHKLRREKKMSVIGLSSANLLFRHFSVDLRFDTYIFCSWDLCVC